MTLVFESESCQGVEFLERKIESGSNGRKRSSDRSAALFHERGLPAFFSNPTARVPVQNLPKVRPLSASQTKKYVQNKTPELPKTRPRAKGVRSRLNPLPARICTMKIRKRKQTNESIARLANRLQRPTGTKSLACWTVVRLFI